MLEGKVTWHTAQCVCSRGRKRQGSCSCVHPYSSTNGTKIGDGDGIDY